MEARTKGGGFKSSCNFFVTGVVPLPVAKIAAAHCF